MMVKNVGKAFVIFAIATATIAGSAQAQRNAQNASGREGFWISGGLGYGSLGCDNCSSRQGGVSGGLALGGTITPRFLLGVGTSGWSKDENGARLTVAEIDARVRFYPSATGGFFLTGGLGYGSVTGSAGAFTATENGAGAIIGLGYDVRVARNMSVTPFWNAYGMKNSNTDANVGQLGVALTWH